MQSKDIKVGETYAWNTGWKNIRKESWAKATVLTEPQGGMVKILLDGPKSHHQGEREVSVREIMCLWAEHVEEMAMSAQTRQRSIQAQQDASDSIESHIGEELWEEYGFYCEFKVHGDGSYNSEVRLPRTALAKLIEAAYEQGRKDAER